MTARSGEPMYSPKQEEFHLLLKCSKSYQPIPWKYQLLSHYFFMPEWDLAPKVRLTFRAQATKTRKKAEFDNRGRKPSVRARDTLKHQPQTPTSVILPTFPSIVHTAHFLKFFFLRSTFFHPVVGIEVSVRHYWHPIPGAVLSTQLRGKRDQLGEKAILARQWGSL